MPEPTQQFSDFLQKALKNFQCVAEAEEEPRRKCLDDLKFSTGEQWNPTVKARRERKNKPCLTMDQMQQSIRIVHNEYRQQRPAIEVNPVGDDADVDTAEILQGTVRHIEVNSDAEVAYDNAHEFVLRIGFGSWRLVSDYADDETDEQEIYVRKIRNPFSVYWQPGVDQEDAKWAFIVTDVPRETYSEDYPESEMSLTNFASTGDAGAEWVTKESVRVAEYFRVTEEKVDGKKRPVKKVKWHKFNAIEFLNEHGEVGEALPGTSIPIFTAYGDDIDVDGKRYLAGLVRNGKDAQRQYNYMSSAATQSVALAPQAPWLVAEGQTAGRENEWAAANTGDIEVLYYKQVDVGGKVAPVPQRQTVEPPIQAIQMLVQQARSDLQAALGVYDPSLGQRRGDESGKAIERLQSQGSVATMNYSDNVARVMRRYGKVLLEWIRDKYDVPRVRRIIKPDGSVQHVVTHNGPDQKEAAEQLLTEKIKKIYDIGVGRYDVTIQVGPSYQTKRQEAVATQLDLLKSIPPQMATNVMDLVTGNMDIPQAKEFAARFKRMIPPQILGGDEDDPQVQLQKAQATLQEMSQQHQLLTQALTQAQKVIETKQIEQQGKFQIAQLQEQSAQAMEEMKLKTQITLAEINTKAQEVSERMAWEREMAKELHAGAHDLAMQKDDQAHQQDMATQQQAAAAQGQQADQQHDQEMALQNQGAE